jgi:caa(3)-type oxidase subunit IV
MAGHGAERGYVSIWVVLVLLLLVSVAAGSLGHRLLATGLIFGIAIVKAGLVVAQYMHLRLEPKWVAVMMGGAVFLMLVLFAGLYPDIVRVYGD